jgi:trafficking protein particle complex subunit 6
MHRLDHTVRREVAESSLEFVLMEVVEYFLRGGGTRGFVAPGGTAASSGTVMEVSSRLESLGFDVGTRLVERYAMERERLEADLDIVKFICKDFWEQTFKKQVDVLRTNHKGLYVLTDNNFRWLSRVSMAGTAHAGAPEDYLVFPCGLVCGALSRLGLKCRVTAEIVPDGQTYKCSFHVQVIQS